MATHKSVVKVYINGQPMTDFKGFTEKSVERRKAVDLAGGTGVCNLTPRYAFSLKYVLPAGEEFDFDSLEDATFEIDFLDGTKRRYGGVYSTTLGDASYDGEDVTKDIDFISTKGPQ